jgi:hypothetical protein
MRVKHTLQRKKKLRGLSPNFHVDVSVSDLYIPTIGLSGIICARIQGIYIMYLRAVLCTFQISVDFYCVPVGGRGGWIGGGEEGGEEGGERGGEEGGEEGGEGGLEKRGGAIHCYKTLRRIPPP